MKTQAQKKLRMC
ncbi:hypothetical protein PFNF54_00440 [Plasmodium falciparum NF54]|uniref:Uncharacterized protein n=1 Tax=Plasmodium falciparum (isolate NF54) TaxID=5843 RepID=W7KCT5_PLAFO|nr:hypothetical protein PFNF54_00440 [Plasmodium falciparum NF54]